MSAADEARKVVALGGDTYSSYEVIGLLSRLEAENPKLRAALKDCADLLMLGDERGNPNETELEAYERAYALLKE